VPYVIPASGYATTVVEKAKARISPGPISSLHFATGQKARQFDESHNLCHAKSTMKTPQK